MSASNLPFLCSECLLELGAAVSARLDGQYPQRPRGSPSALQLPLSLPITQLLGTEETLYPLSCFPRPLTSGFLIAENTLLCFEIPVYFDSVIKINAKESYSAGEETLLYSPQTVLAQNTVRGKTEKVHQANISVAIVLFMFHKNTV